MSTPISISSSLLITASTAVMRFILPYSQIAGSVIVGDSTVSLKYPLITFTPGGCIYQGVGCWSGIGFFSVSRRSVIRRVMFTAIYDRKTVVEMDVECSIEVEPGEYFVLLHFSVELPNTGYVKLHAL